MENILKFLPVFALCAGGWAVINGTLHDIFVLRSEHGKIYDRTLLRLLMDGHILISSGAFLLLSYIGLRENASWGYYVAGFASFSLLVYCAMIFPFLKSLGTIIINASLLIGLIIGYIKSF
ncbi:MAG: hypothetical protein ACXWEY_06370 [Bacteroidia bacterium]